ncbi:MAG: FAD-dependent oxidoreductase, partial [Terriglobus sp.]
FGVNTGNITIDLSKVYERKQSLLLGSRNNITKSLETSENSTLLMGQASFAEQQPGDGTYRIDVALNDGGAETIVAKRVFINTGERPHIPDVEGLKNLPILDSTAMLDLQEVPEHLLVLGAGYIALEFAQMFLRFGSKVTVIERGERIAQHEDDDVATCLREILTEDGLNILTCSAVTRALGSAGDITLELVTSEGPVVLKGTHLLVATGRTPNVEPLHLDRVGVKQNEHGHIVVNDTLETSAKNIWALGDVKGGPAFTHISYDDYRILRTNLLEDGSASIKDRLLTYCMFTDPELARFGLNEADAKMQGKNVRVAAIPMKWMARANEMNEPRGMMKALVDPETKQILGATILGVDGGEVAAQLQIAMMGKLPYTALREGVFAHPTKSEALNTLFTNFRDGKD